LTTGLTVVAVADDDFTAEDVDAVTVFPDPLEGAENQEETVDTTEVIIDIDLPILSY
jgi:hypothetical protein